MFQTYFLGFDYNGRQDFLSSVSKKHPGSPVTQNELKTKYRFNISDQFSADETVR